MESLLTQFATSKYGGVTFLLAMQDQELEQERRARENEREAEQQLQGKLMEATSTVEKLTAEVAAAEQRERERWRKRVEDLTDQVRA